jgi:hypothetical protein
MSAKDKVGNAWTRGYIPLALAVVGAILVPVGFFTGIDAALNGAGNGAHASEAVFFVGVAFALIALGGSIVALVRRGAKVLPILALTVSLLPGAFMLILFVAARK